MEKSGQTSTKICQTDAKIRQADLKPCQADARLCRTDAQPCVSSGALPEEGRTYVCIDLKSFYASVECIDRGLDPFEANLVVADPDRGRTTICLAVSPALKAHGVPGRCRVFEIPEHLDYLMAPPRMSHYMEVSAQIYAVYLRYVSPEDIHVYSIDECFIDATPYLSLYEKTAREFAQTLIDAVFAETGICATAGIGTNLFLAKVALDITAKHASDHIGYLDLDSFVETVQKHRPITDIWNVGPGIAKRLARYQVYDLEGVTLLDEDVLYKEFGVNAELLIDHAYGREPCTIKQIKEYEPKATSMANGQVLPSDYSFEEARMVLREMVDASVLELVEKGQVAGGISLSVGYGKQRLGPVLLESANAVEGAFAAYAEDGGAGLVGSVASAGPRREGPPSRAGRGAGEGLLPGVKNGQGLRGFRAGAYAHKSYKLSGHTNSLAELLPEFLRLFDENVNPDLQVRRMSIGFSALLPEEFASCNLFTDNDAREEERTRQKAILAVKNRFGKNALIRGTSLKEKATARERNAQVGGHRA